MRIGSEGWFGVLLGGLLCVSVSVKFELASWHEVVDGEVDWVVVQSAGFVLAWWSGLFEK